MKSHQIKICEMSIKQYLGRNLQDETPTSEKKKGHKSMT